MGKEIERKWMMSELPAWVLEYPHTALVQGYLSTVPTVRVRQDGDEYYLTYKGAGELVREEYNLPLSAEAFSKMIHKCDGIVITKERYRVPIDIHGERTDEEQKYLAEIDIFKNEYEGRVYLEVEFPCEEEARAFAAPKWYGEEVTGRKGFTNAEMSLVKY